MKKIIILALVLVMALTIFTGCEEEAGTSNPLAIFSTKDSTTFLSITRSEEEAYDRALRIETPSSEEVTIAMDCPFCGYYHSEKIKEGSHFMFKCTCEQPYYLFAIVD